MKKSRIISAVCISVAIWGAMLTMSLNSSTPEGEKDFETVDNYLRETIYPKLYKVVDSDAKKSFSRCPSGFVHVIDQVASTDETIIGTMYYRQGCSSEVFCEFKLNMTTKYMSMRNEGAEEYASMGRFIDEYSDKEAEI